MEVESLRVIFDKSLKQLLALDSAYIVSGVNERSICGRLALHLQRASDEAKLDGYFADVECNRKQNGEVKTVLDGEMNVIVVNCDLILHSRGGRIKDDNLIAIEVKKSSRPRGEKIDDCDRLKALTKNSYDDIWSNDGTAHPEHVCGYHLGVFVELNLTNREVKLEYYQNGALAETGSDKF